MKAFHFRLEQALRWRGTQLTIQKTRFAAAAGRLAEIEAAASALRSSLFDAQRRIVVESNGGATQSFAAFKAAASVRIRDYEAQAEVARRNTALEMNRLVEADQKVRVLQKLRTAHHADWRQDLDRELATFAEESFLSRRS
jgi:hypothetical protein